MSNEAMFSFSLFVAMKTRWLEREGKILSQTDNSFHTLSAQMICVSRRENSRERNVVDDDREEDTIGRFSSPLSISFPSLPRTFFCWFMSSIDIRSRGNLQLGILVRITNTLATKARAASAEHFVESHTERIYSSGAQLSK